MRASFLQSWSPLQRISAVGLAAACLVLSAVLAGELMTPIESGFTPPAAPRNGAADRSEPVAARYALPPLSRFAAVTERPLFSEDRRPAPDDDDGSIGPVSSLRLAGIVLSPESREAMVSHGDPPVFVHLHEGEKVDGWVVHSILRDRIVLGNGPETHELRLLKKPGEGTDDERGRSRSLDWRDD